MTILETERTILRQFHMGDEEALVGILGHPEVMRFSLHGPYSREEIRDFISRCQNSYKEKGAGLYAVELKENNRMIGYCGLCFQSIEGREEVEIGYRLAVDMWNRGLATECALAVRFYGFKSLGYTKLISVIEPENRASIRVAQKVGMSYEKSVLFKKTVKTDIYSISAL